MGASVAAVVGLACLWLCLQCDIYFPLTLAPDVLYADSGRAVLLHCLFVLVGLGATGLAFRFRTVLLEAERRHRWACPLTLGALGTLAAASLRAGSMGEGPLPWVALGAVLCALWLVATALFWMRRLTRLDERRAWWLLFAGFAVAVVVLGVAGAFDVAKETLLVPWVALGGYAAVFSPPDSQGADQGAERADGRLVRELPFNLVVPACALTVCAAVGVRAMADLSLPEGNSTLLTAAFTACITAVMAAVVARTGVGWRAEVGLFALLACTVVVGLTLSVFLEERQFLLSPRRCIVAAEHCLELYMMLVIVRGIRQKRLPCIPCACVFVLMGILLPRFAAYDLTYLLIRVGAFQTGSNAFTALACASLVFGITVWSLVSLLSRGERQQAASPDERYAPLCERMGRASGLSGREVEVAALLCEGMSQKAIAAAMTVAESTVKTHVKHLYAKLGIHSRQELMAIVESYERGGSSG